MQARTSLPLRRNHAARPVHVHPDDYLKAWHAGLHVDDSHPIPLFMSVNTDRWGGDVRVHVFSTLYSISVELDGADVIRSVPRIED